MKFKWHKKGIIFKPDGKQDWMYNYAQCPCPLDFGDFLRVYISTREKYTNEMVRSFGGFVDLDKNDLTKVLRVSERPVMDLGGIGEFDEFGIMPNGAVKHGNDYYLYYSGWTRGVSVPYQWAVGLGVSQDGERFKKIDKGPVLGPTYNEPYLQACPIVYKFGENDWHMYYLSGVQWIESPEKLESQYLLMHATSTDGINWVRNGIPIVETKVEYESQTSASIVKLDDKYHMFFCYRHGLGFRTEPGKGYRVGYAVSDDLCTWHRDDSVAGIDVSESGWDSEAIAYPRIVQINDKYFMFYCGNHFGEDGFGYAELEIVSD